MSKVKVAIIGCGGIANQKHFPALKNNSDLNEIVAFCDIKIERAQKAAAEFGVAGAQVTADYREVLAKNQNLRRYDDIKMELLKRGHRRQLSVI